MADFWLSEGPITASERQSAFSYLRKHNIPITKASVGHRVSQMRKRNDLNRWLKGKADSTTDPTNPWQIIYGASEVGGTITFINTSGPTDQPNLYLHMVITLAAHQINYVQEVYFDGFALTWDTDLTTRPTGVVNATGIFAGFVKMQINYGSDSQSALSELIADCPTYWTTNHKQSGHAHLYLRLKWDATLFTSGTPDTTFLVVGKYDVLDTRTSTLAPGAGNVAMLLNDYLTNTRWGLGVSQSEINTTRLNSAINSCEDLITLAAGGSENRYLIFSTFGSDQSVGQVIQDLLASMAGRLTYTSGQWNIFAGVGQTPVVSIDEDDMLSDITVVTKTPRVNSFNTVRGTFISTQNNWEESDFPTVTNSTYIAEDNGETIFDDLTFAHVKSASQCQRLAKVELEANRQGITVEFTGSLRCYQAEPGEWLYLSNTRFGWSSKIFEVVTSAIVIDQDANGVPYFAVKMSLQETASGVYDWNTGNETTYDLAPDTNLPNPFQVAPPSALMLASGTAYLYLRSDGTVFSRLYASWTAPQDAFVVNGGYIEIQYKLSSSSTWQDFGDIPGSSTFAYILDVEDGYAYDVRIRSVNAMGSKSGYIEADGHIVIGKTAPPSDVTGFSSTIENIGLRFVWTAIPDLDLKQYEVRIGSTSDTWDSAVPVFQTHNNTFYYQFAVAGVYRARIKAVDTSLNYSLNDAYLDVTIVSPGAVTDLRAWQVDNNVVLDWDVPATGTLPIDYYEVVRGALAGSGAVIGSVNGTFFSYVEMIGAVYFYTITAIDLAGNRGASSYVQQVVAQPRDFYFHADETLLAGNATTTNAAVIGVPGTSAYDAGDYGLLIPANVTETWNDHYVSNGMTCVQDWVNAGYNEWIQPTYGSETWTGHFVNNSFSSIQDFINAGYADFINPVGSSTAGSATWTLDVGTVVQEATISVILPVLTSVAGGASWSITISYRQFLTDPWTNSVSTGSPLSAAVLGTIFRYVQVVIDITSLSATGYGEIYNSGQLVVRTKKQTDGGIVAVNASDATMGGTPVSFNKQFIEVLKITGSAIAGSIGTGQNVIVNFINAPYPTQFQLLLYDKNGTALSGYVSWDAEGLVSVND